MNFSSFDLIMTILVPSLCIFVPCIAITINYMMYQQPNSSTTRQNVEPKIESKGVELPSDMVQMYVELETDETAGREKRAQACEMEGRGPDRTRLA